MQGYAKCTHKIQRVWFFCKQEWFAKGGVHFVFLTFCFAKCSGDAKMYFGNARATCMALFFASPYATPTKTHFCWWTFCLQKCIFASHFGTFYKVKCSKQKTRERYKKHSILFTKCKAKRGTCKVQKEHQSNWSLGRTFYFVKCKAHQFIYFLG